MTADFLYRACLSWRYQTEVRTHLYSTSTRTRAHLESRRQLDEVSLQTSPSARIGPSVQQHAAIQQVVDFVRRFAPLLRPAGLL